MDQLEPPQSHTVPPEADGLRLDVFLARIPAIGGRRRAKELIHQSAVAVAGEVATKGGQIVLAGETVAFRLPVGAVAPSAGPDTWEVELPILYEDAFVLVIDKPAGLAAHRPQGPRGATTPNVADIALRHAPELSLAAGDDRRGIVHRLDRDTTGAMVLAKDDDALHSLKAQFKARTVEKEYRAIVYGEPRFDSDWIDRAIAPHPVHGDRMVVVSAGGREASTYYEVVERLAGFTHLRCLPKSGRTHQIRVHLTSIGLSLVGDRVYRSRRNQQSALPEGAPDPARQCLHAYRLAFDHPRTRERVTFEAPIPEDMKRLLDWLRDRRPS